MDHDRAFPWLRDKWHSHGYLRTSLGIDLEVEMDLGFVADQPGRGKPSLLLSVVVAQRRCAIAGYTRTFVEVRGVFLASGTLIEAPDMEPEGALTVDAHHEGRRFSVIENRVGGRKVAQVTLEGTPAHGRDLRTTAEATVAEMGAAEVVVARIRRPGGKEQRGCSQGSYGYGAETGHDFLSET